MWAMKLKPYDIKYEPRKIIEEQVLVNFIVEFTTGTLPQSDYLKRMDPECRWSLK